MKRRDLWVLIQLGALLAAPVALMAVPTRVVESGPAVCLFKRALHHDCPGCGMTRAFSCVAHGQFARAWQFNKLVVVAFPLAAWLWGWFVFRLGASAVAIARHA